jgi:hypothetical protein
MEFYKRIIAIGEGTQIAKRFDKATIVKICKGALISGTGAMALYLLDYIGNMSFTNINIAALTAFAVPFLVNLVKEYLKGVQK